MITHIGCDQYLLSSYCSVEGRAEHSMDHHRGDSRQGAAVQHHINFSLLCNLVDEEWTCPTIEVVDKVIQPRKVADITLIKDMRTPTSPAQVFEILDIIGGALASDMPIFNVGASSSSTPQALVHSRPLLVLTGYTLFITS